MKNMLKRIKELGSSLLSSIFFLIPLFILSSCSMMQDQDLELPPGTKAIVVFVPGYKGSELRKTESKQVVWLNFQELFFGSNSLALNTKQYSSIEETEYQAGAILKNLSIIPGLVSYGVYGECLSKIKGALPINHQLRIFSYDWRRGADYNAQKLLTFLKTLRKKTPLPIKIITHSMGGIVSTFALRLRGDGNEYDKENTLVDRIIYLGAPFHGALAAFRDLHYEVPPLMSNTSLINRASYNSFESAYDLMPPSFATNFISAANLNNRKIIYDYSKWDKYSWGLLGYRENKLYDPKGIKTYIKANLDRSDIIHMLIHSKVEKGSIFNKLKILNVVGVGTPTLARGRFDESLENGLNFKGEDLFLEGDGIVTKESATLPKALGELKNAREIEVKHEHGTLCANETAISEIENLLME